MTSPSQPPKGDETRELIAKLARARKRFDEAAQLHADIDAELETIDQAAEALASHQATNERLTEERDELRAEITALKETAYGED